MSSMNGRGQVIILLFIWATIKYTLENPSKISRYYMYVMYINYLFIYVSLILDYYNNLF